MCAQVNEVVISIFVNVCNEIIIGMLLTWTVDHLPIWNTETFGATLWDLEVQRLNLQFANFHYLYYVFGLNWIDESMKVVLVLEIEEGCIGGELISQLSVTNTF